jgi:hypothetical protein
MNPLATKAAAMLRNGDGSVNWKLIGILGLGVAVLATVMGYVKERKAEMKKVTGA